MDKVKFLFCLGLWLGIILTHAGQAKPATRYGFFIGANKASGKEPLKYSYQDARRIYSTLRKLGGFKTNNCILLKQPDIAGIKKSFSFFRTQIQQDHAAKLGSEFLLFYSGHSDSDNLCLADEKLNYQEFKKMVDSLEAKVTIVILDSCSSGGFIRKKGGILQKIAPMDNSMQVEGKVFISSSSIDEFSQEYDLIRSSFFSYYLNNGLQGAADTLSDGQVTLQELYQYAYRETLSKTKKAKVTQHPNFSINMKGTGDIVLTDIRETPSGLEIHKNLSGTLYIRNKEDIFIAEINKQKGEALTFSIGSGPYKITIKGDESLHEGMVDVPENKIVSVDKHSFVEMDFLATTLKGGLPERQFKKFYNDFLIKDSFFRMEHGLTMMESVQEVSRWRRNIRRSALLTSATTSTFVVGYVLAGIFYSRGKSRYNEYQQASDPDLTTSLGDQYNRLFKVANVFFYLAESALISTAAVIPWLIMSSARFRKNKRILNSSRDIKLSLHLRKNRLFAGVSCFY